MNAGGFQPTVALIWASVVTPPVVVAALIVGGSGTVAGTALADSGEYVCCVPIALMARTRNRYCAPLVRPVKVCVVAGLVNVTVGWITPLTRYSTS